MWQGASKRPKKWSGEAPAGEREEEAQSQYKNRLGQVKKKKEKEEVGPRRGGIEDRKVEVKIKEK